MAIRVVLYIDLLEFGRLGLQNQVCIWCDRQDVSKTHCAQNGILMIWGLICLCCLWLSVGLLLCFRILGETGETANTRYRQMRVCKNSLLKAAFLHKCWRQQRKHKFCLQRVLEHVCKTRTLRRSKAAVFNFQQSAMHVQCSDCSKIDRSTNLQVPLI